MSDLEGLKSQIREVLDTSCSGLFRDNNEQKEFVGYFSDELARQKFKAMTSTDMTIVRKCNANIRHLGATVRTQLAVRGLSLGYQNANTLERVCKGIVGAMVIAAAKTAFQKFAEVIAKKLEEHQVERPGDLVAQIDVQTFVDEIRPVIDSAIAAYEDDNKFSLGDILSITPKLVRPLMKMAAKVKDATGAEKKAFVVEAIRWIYREIDPDLPWIPEVIEVPIENFLLDNLIPSLVDVVYDLAKPELEVIENA